MHVPYRAAEITPQFLEALAGVDLILHAGDVDEPWHSIVDLLF